MLSLRRAPLANGQGLPPVQRGYYYYDDGCGVGDFANSTYYRESTTGDDRDDDWDDDW